MRLALRTLGRFESRALAMLFLCARVQAVVDVEVEVEVEVEVDVEAVFEVEVDVEVDVEVEALFEAEAVFVVEAFAVSAVVVADNNCCSLVDIDCSNIAVVAVEDGFVDIAVVVEEAVAADMGMVVVVAANALNVASALDQ